MDLSGLPKRHFKCILADPPWTYRTWSAKGTGRSAEQHYHVMSIEELCALPVSDVAADDSVLFLWFTWPCLADALELIKAWGFVYKTCAFCWIKADARQIEMFREDYDTEIKLGHWTRSNSEACFLATMGSPKREDASIRQAIVEPAREHSRKPDCVYSRVERLVQGPRLELFSRSERRGWVSIGNEVGKFKEVVLELPDEGSILPFTMERN